MNLYIIVNNSNIFSIYSNYRSLWIWVLFFDSPRMRLYFYSSIVRMNILHKPLRSLIAILLLLNCIQAVVAGNKREVEHLLNELPVSFRKNMGQWNSNILYQGNSPGWDANVYFLKNGLSFGFKRPGSPPQIEEEDAPENIEFLVWNLHFKNALQNISVEASGEVNSNTNYLYGSDLSQHKTNVPDFRMIKYINVYQNIDIRYYSTGQELKHDFIVKGGGNISSIEIELEGIKNISLNEKGQLLIHTLWGTLVEEIPESYQYINNKKINKSISYRIINETTYGFSINEKYNHNAELVIDPVNLLWSTFVGGNLSNGNGYLRDIAVDAAGNVYATGWYTASFPVTAGAYNMSFSGGSGIISAVCSDAFVFKLNASGTALLYATYIGGANNEEGGGIAINSAGEAYITGYTKSSGFPVTAGAYDVTYNGAGNYHDAFFLKLNGAGSALLYSTFLGGSLHNDNGNAVCINSSGDAVIAGNTSSANFPVTAGAYQVAHGGASDVFICQISPSGNGPADLIYSTFIGGSAAENAYGLKLTSAGEPVACGYSQSLNFPVTTGSPLLTHSGSNDAVLIKLNSSGSQLLYSTYLGGTEAEIAKDVFIDNTGHVYLTGYTASPDFPVTQGAYDTSHNGGSARTVIKSDVFVTKVNLQGNGMADILYSTFVGGTENEGGSGIAVNNKGEVFVSGTTSSPDFPVTSCAYDLSYNATAASNGSQDLFLIKLNSTFSYLQYGTFIGGLDADYADPQVELFGECKDQVYLSTTSHSTNFPTTAGVFQPVKLNTTWDQPAILTFKAETATGFTDSLVSTSCIGTTIAFADTSTASCVWDTAQWIPDSWQWYFGDGNTSTLQHPTHTYTTPGTYNVKLITYCPKDSAVKTITINPLPPPITVTTSGNITICLGASATISANASGGAGNYTYSWSPGSLSTQSITVSPAVTTTYSVLVTDASGCSSAIQTLTVTIATSPVVINASAGTSMCIGSTATLSATASGGNGNYTYTWLPVNTNNNIIVVSPSVTTTYTIIAGDNCNNIPDTAMVTVNVNALPHILITASDSAGCPPLCVSFYSGNNPSIVQNQWNFGDGTQSNTLGYVTHCYTTPGIYSVQLTVTDNNGCSNTLIKNNWINVHPVPVAAFSYSPQPISIFNPVVNFINQSQGHNTSSWSFGDVANSFSNEESPVFTYSDTGLYHASLVVTNEYGCNDTANNILKVMPDFSFYAPNAFTPNNDNINNVFIPRFEGVNGNDYELIIFDRWGNLIFKTNDTTKGWDGRANGGTHVAQIDTYVWKVKFTNILGDKYQYIGHVNLLK